MFRADLEDEDSPARKSQDGMSLSEKMMLWQNQSMNSNPATVDDLFLGVEGDIDEHTNHPELATYSRAILQSNAYEWFIQRLLKQSSLHWGSEAAATATRDIRRAVMNGLPSGRISKSRDPAVLRVEFQLPIERLSERLALETQKNRTRLALEAGSRAVVLVSSADDCIQAMSVAEYIEQTWGVDVGLLRAFFCPLPSQVNDLQPQLGTILIPSLQEYTISMILHFSKLT